MGSPLGDPIVKVQIPNCCVSPQSGFWPHPHKENFYRKKAPWKTKKTLQGNKLIYNYEDNMLMYAGYNEIPLYNKFEILSDKDQMCTSGDIKTYPEPLGDQNYTNNSNYFD